MEVIIRSGIIVTGLLFIRKLAMGKISRKLQYYMWGILPIVLLILDRKSTRLNSSHL